MPMKMKSIKGIDLFCASPASTAICSSTDQRSMIRDGPKPLHRLANHYNTLTNNSPRASCTNITQLPFTPRPSSSSSSSSYREQKPQKPSCSVKPNDLLVTTTRRKSSADVSDLLRRYHKKYTHHDTTTSHSSRYLLGDSPFLDSLSETITKDDPNTTSLALVPSTPVWSEERELRKSRSYATGRRLGSSLMDVEKKEISNKKTTSLAMVNGSDQGGIKAKQLGNHAISTNYSNGQRQCSKNDSLLLKSSSSSATSRDQVVVLRVSLHCKGCAGKLKKHLSKMEGVTSFNIDLETKKVTVIGNVTPLSVLTSISKVKYAQFWPTSASASSTSSSSSSTSSTMDLN